MKHAPRSSLIVVLSLLIVFSSVGIAFAGNAPSELSGHWAEKDLLSWAEQGLIKGFKDGSFRPDAFITRAELMAIINRVFEFEETTEVSFRDLDVSNWASTDIQKGVKAGYITGYTDQTFRAQNNVSREEAAVIISRLLGLNNAEQVTNQFTDHGRIASWSKGAVGAVVAHGIVSVFDDGTFRPDDYLTRAEAVVMLQRAIQVRTHVYDRAGTYGPSSGTAHIAGDAFIMVSGITLQNTVIDGDLYLAPTIGNGEAYLNNVTIKGVTYVLGGGENSVYGFNSKLGVVVVSKLSEEALEEAHSLGFGRQSAPEMVTSKLLSDNDPVQDDYFNQLYENAIEQVKKLSKGDSSKDQSEELVEKLHLVFDNTTVDSVTLMSDAIVDNKDSIIDALYLGETFVELNGYFNDVRVFSDFSDLLTILDNRKNEALSDRAELLNMIIQLLQSAKEFDEQKRKQAEILLNAQSLINNLFANTEVRVSGSGTINRAILSELSWGSVFETPPENIDGPGAPVASQPQTDINDPEPMPVPPTPVNPQLSLGHIADQISNEGEPVQLVLSATIPPNSFPQFTANGLPNGLSIDNNSGVISGMLSYDNVSATVTSAVYNVTVHVSTSLESTSQSFTWTIYNVDTTPKLTVLGHTPDPITGEIFITTKISDLFEIQLDARDEDGDEVDYVHFEHSHSTDLSSHDYGLPYGLTFDPNTQKIIGQPQSLIQPGSYYMIIIFVKDSTLHPSGLEYMDMANVVIKWTIE